MAFSAEHYQWAIDQVDPTITLDFELAEPGYEPSEWSYSFNGGDDTYYILAGSSFAAEQAGAHLLDALGFRFYTPHEDFWVFPGSIATNLTEAKQSYWFFSNRWFLTYSGHSWEGVHSASRDLMNDALKKWQKLNAMGPEEAFPAGHRWGSVISNASIVSSGFWTANPQLLNAGGTGFDLTVTGADYDNLVMICAAFLLTGTSSINEFHNTHFDPTDSDPTPSTLVFPFTKAVADQCRIGTDAIGPYAALPGNPELSLGIYAYAGHRIPPFIDEPEITWRPGVYTQVALAFNDTPYSYNDLVRFHALKADRISLREYLDIPTWFDMKPLVNGRTKPDYFDRYDQFKADGAVGSNAESTANWLVNIVMARTFIVKCRTGVTDYQGALDEIMTNIFDDDPKVRELYEFWSDPFQTYHKWNLNKSFNIVDDMIDGWYKDLFMYVHVIWAEQLYLPNKMVEGVDPEWATEDDPFFVAFSKMCNHVTAIRELDIFGSYAFLRDNANGNIKGDYPSLGMFDFKPPTQGRSLAGSPAWYHDTLVLPTWTDFDTLHAQLAADTYRAADLDSSDLVLMRNITPVIDAWTDATGFEIEDSGGTFVFIGPGTVYIEGEETVYDEDGVPNGTVPVTYPQDYESGSWVVQQNGDFEITHSGGELFLVWFPTVRREPLTGSGDYGLYIPTRCATEVDIVTEGSFRVQDQTGVITIVPATDPSVIANIGPGQIKLSNGSTSGFATVVNANPYISMKATQALLPRAIAQEDFPSRIEITVA